MIEPKCPPAPESCQVCPYTKRVQRKHGQTIHCDLDPAELDVTHVKGRSPFCPMRYSWR